MTPNLHLFVVTFFRREITHHVFPHSKGRTKKKGKSRAWNSSFPVKENPTAEKARNKRKMGFGGPDLNQVG